MSKIKLGVDVGYKNTKYCYGVDTQSMGQFPSTVKEGKPMELDRDSIHIVYQGKDYIIGSQYDVRYTMDLNKIHDLCFVLPLFTAIALSMKGTSEDIQLVTGLPPAQFPQLKEELKKSLIGVNVDIKINGIDKNFKISDAIIYPQAAGYFLLEPKLFEREGAQVLVADFGGRTLDACLFENYKPIKFESYLEYGMNQLFSTIANYWRGKYMEKFSFMDAEKYVRLGDLYIGDVPQGETDYINTMLKDLADKSIQQLMTDFPYRRCRVVWMGGGAVALHKYLPNGDRITPQTVYDNARIFFKVASEKFA